jgi:hypothetical protein
VNLLEMLDNMGRAVDHFGVVGLAGEMALSAEPELSMCNKVSDTKENYALGNHPFSGC